MALVNPNRQDDLSQLGHLAAVGVTFMTLVAVQQSVAPEWILQSSLYST